MKRLKFALLVLLFLVSLAVPVIPARAEAGNLLANPSVETDNGAGLPANWTGNSWGTNTSNLTYSPEGHTGSKSLRIDTTARTDGDAKWMADPVNVNPNTTYTYSSFYKATAATELDLQYTDASGNVTYAYLQSVAPSTDWAQVTAEFTTPANVSKVVVMHIVAQVGGLQIDDFSLTEKVVLPPPTSGNLVANPSAETANGTLPASWTPTRWGTNNATLTYATDGHTGSKSLLTTMTAHTDGDAKWMSDAINVTGNKSYTYTGFYKSTVATELDLQYTDASGNVTYAYGQAVPASSDWSQTTLTFTAPATATKVVVMHILAQVGTVQTDDFSLTENTTTPPPPPGDTSNLFANPSMESANGSSPANWQSNSWGTLTPQFTYENTGRTGSRSVTTTVTQYTDGDAKWYAEPVTVTPGASYTYQDYYKSSVTSRLFAAYIDGSGNWSYVALPDAPVAANWTQYSTTLAVPANAVKVTIFHVLDTTGTLTIDDISLRTAGSDPNPDPNPTPEPGLTIPNSSLEQAGSNASEPVDWQQSSWGTNSSIFEWANDGHTGGKSAKITMSNYTDGDAKWLFSPISSDTLLPGHQYRYTTWYKVSAGVIPHAVAMYLNADGNEEYFGMPDPQPNGTTDWQQYSETFRVPENATAVSVFLFISQNGTLQVDDASLNTYAPVGFNRPLLTMTFDDGHEDNAASALPLLNQYGFKTTHCFATTFIEGQGSQAANNVLAFYNSGHEICSHSVTHPFMTTLTDANLTYESLHSKQYLESITGTTINDFATPYGDYNARVNNELKKYYRSHRTVDEGFNSKDNFDIYRVRVQNIFSTTTAAQVRAWVEQAKTNNTWLVLVYHRIANDPGQYDSYINVFEEHLQTIQQSGITVKTYQSALDEVTAQL